MANKVIQLKDGNDNLYPVGLLTTDTGNAIGINSPDAFTRSMFFQLTSGITVAGVSIENYARGVYIGGTTGALIAIGYGGIIYTAFKNNGTWANAKKFQ